MQTAAVEEVSVTVTAEPAKRGRISEAKRFVSPACVCTVAVSIPSVLVTFIYPAIIGLQGTLQCMRLVRSKYQAIRCCLIFQERS